jgi:hypothetical protein
MGLEEPGLNRLIRSGYDLLGLQTYFTAGPKEVRAWTIHKGDTAPQAAAVIHTDFEKGFIRAEVIRYDDYLAAGGEAGAKDAGKMRVEGKEYVVQDGDVMHFRLMCNRIGHIISFRRLQYVCVLANGSRCDFSCSAEPAAYVAKAPISSRGYFRPQARGHLFIS